MADSDHHFSLAGRGAVGREKRFGMFRLTSVIAFVALAIWLFMDGQHSRLPYDSTPRWILETPGWFLGSAALGLAVLAAVLPAETIGTIILRVLAAKARVKLSQGGRGLGHHGITELGLSNDSNAEGNANQTGFETLRALSQNKHEDQEE